ncbi:MAG: hypothetical protein QOD54_1286 [Sphingomonadales bacterium]|jgi:hypothetical protein|nr:hypothetical protein [Sphingomonadales bacterium]
MRRSIVLVSAAALIGGCGRSDEGAANQAAANAAQPKKKAAYCFFKDSETKGWAASRGKDGNIKVKGKAYRQDSRYQAVLGPPEISGTTASLAPTVTQNMTGFGATDDWWDVAATIPDTAAVDTVTVTCGARTLAELKVPAKG